MQLDSDYRLTLQRILVERCQKNSRYSLRAFARDLGVSPARLSDVINGKKGLSRTSASAIAVTLGLNPTEASYFCDQVESRHARSGAARSAALNRLRTHRSPDRSARDLSLDAFRVVSDWHHFAILQLMKLDTYQDRPEWMARALGVQTIQAKEALARLTRLKLIHKRDGHWKPTEEYVSSPDGIPSDAIRKFHEQILRLSLQALHSQPVQERDFLTSILPVAEQDIPEIKQYIRSFNRKFCEKYSHRPGKNRVYSLAVQWINLTPALKEKKS